MSVSPLWHTAGAFPPLAPVVPLSPRDASGSRIRKKGLYLTFSQ
jgi:hypothetical protein